MPKKLHDIIVATFLPAIKAAGKAEMEHVLSTIKDNRPELYKNTLQGMYSNFLLLKEVAITTKSRVDDGIIELVLEAVKDSAEADGIALS